MVKLFWFFGVLIYIPGVVFVYIKRIDDWHLPFYSLHIGMSIRSLPGRYTRNRQACRLTRSSSGSSRRCWNATRLPELLLPQRWLPSSYHAVCRHDCSSFQRPYLNQVVFPFVHPFIHLPSWSKLIFPQNPKTEDRKNAQRTERDYLFIWFISNVLPYR